MTIYKYGDQVRVIDESIEHGFFRGAEGTITGYTHDEEVGYSYFVLFHSGRVLEVKSYEVELIPNKKKV